jgi:transcriptional regulator GlxA family with amidase domain
MDPAEALAGILGSGRPIRVRILLYPEVEVLDFAGPFEVFSVAARILSHGPQSLRPVFEVATVAATRDVVAARHGLKVVPDFGFDDGPPADLFIVPGGVVDEPMNSARTLDHVRAARRSAALIASVCTGVFVLAKAGIVEDHRVTTHWEDLADLKAAFPRLAVLEDVPFVDEGDVVTSAGISAGIGMSLHIVGRILGMDAARKVARQMQYDWPPAAS